MCGRFVLSSPASDIANEFSAERGLFDIEPSYNVAPSQKIVIIRNDGMNKLLKCRWGFVPAWVKDPDDSYRMINARAETVSEKPAFRNAFRNHRCIIVADGFFEWHMKNGKKKPVFIRMKNAGTFAFAGLYNVWTSSEGVLACSCAIITTEANDLLVQYHDRMPVILSKENYGLWLDPDMRDKKVLQSLLNPYSSDEMDAYYVSSKVNSPDYNAADILDQVKV